MVAELTDMNRNLMMSIDIVPVPTDEALHNLRKPRIQLVDLRAA